MSRLRDEADNNEIFKNRSTIRSAVLGIVAMVLTGQVALLILYLSKGMLIEAVITSAGFIPLLITMELNRRNNHEAAVVVLAVSLSVLITVRATDGAGVYHVGVTAFPAILVIASLILRRRTMILLALLIFACLGWLIFGAKAGWYQPQYPQQIFARQFFITGFVSLGATLSVQILTKKLRIPGVAIQREFGEKQTAEKTLRHAEELYRNMVEIISVISYRDISRIDQLLNELKSKNDELQNFTYTVSHDLKAPLVTISGFVGYLEQDAARVTWNG